MEKSPESSLETVTNGLIQQAVEEIDRKYGKHGEHPLEYHNVEHTLDVIESARLIGSKALANGKITEREYCLLLIAAAHHDIAHGLSRDMNEIVSADAARSNMEKAGIFTDEDILTVTDAILGTRTRVIDGRLYQAATHSSQYVTRLLADSDLSSLGSPQEIYWSKAQALRKEHEASGAKYEDYIHLQRSILGSHRFLTDEANELFPYQADNLAYVESLLGDIAL